jgi:NAD(P)-dependent dehydrogenase (short-subunit alcohol dehydrogenase family)
MTGKAIIYGASGGIGAALVQALAARGWQVAAGARRENGSKDRTVTPFRFDLTDEESIAAAADAFADWQPDLVIVATGALTLSDGTGPERSVKALDPAAMLEVMRLNTVGPALIAKHVLPLLPRDRRSVFAALSARVGSIGDNRLGGWHSYRASKAALNMLLRNFAIEMARTHPEAVIAGLHPGTVATDLSAPFKANVPSQQLFAPDVSAVHLLTVLDGLTRADSGGVFDWRGDRLPD